MNNSIQILRRLLTRRNLKGVISQAYCKRNEGDDGGGEGNKDAQPAKDMGMVMRTVSETKQSIETVNAKAESTIVDHQLSKENGFHSTSFNVIDSELTEMKPVENNSVKIEKGKTQLKNLLEGYEANVKQKGDETFTSLLRQSSFIDMGDPIGKIVVGKIFEVVDNDLYIDFGWKFHTVCKKPNRFPEKYKIGAKVFLVIKDLELTARFLGDKKYTNLLEADCEIVIPKRHNSRRI